jgi:UDP-glucose 4-epimerase
MYRALITGSSGQIGTNLALALLDAGHQVIGMDVRRNTWTAAFHTLRRDLRRRIPPDSLSPITPQVVVHLAAHAKVHELVRRPELALENIAMTFNALEYCRAHDLPLVYASSREVYGNIPGDITEESCADFNQAASPYSASKLSGEALVYSYARCYGLRYIVFRFSNVYGRYDNDLKRMERVIPLFIRDISQGRPVTVFGPEKLLDFTYVDDCVSGITAGVDLLTSGAAVNETINLAYGRGHTLLELTDYIGDAVGVTPRVTLRRSLTGEVTRYVADIGKARALLGYAPQVPLQEGVRRAVAWGYGRTDEADSTVARRDDPIPQGA